MHTVRLEDYLEIFKKAEEDIRKNDTEYDTVVIDKTGYSQGVPIIFKLSPFWERHYNISLYANSNVVSGVVAVFEDEPSFVNFLLRWS